MQDTTQQYLMQPPARTWSGKFAEGATVPLLGFRYMNRHPRLWRYAILPIVVNAVITGLAFLMLIVVAGWLITDLHPRLVESLDSSLQWLAIIAEIAIAALILLVCAIVTVLIWKLLSGILCGYFYGQLAEQTERELGLGPQELKSITFVYELIDTVINLSLLIFVNGCIFSLNILPLVGGLLSVVLSFTFTWYLLGVDSFSYPLAMRGVRRWSQFRYGREHGMHTLGLGSAIFLFEFIPIFGALLLTTATVGSVLLHRRIQFGKASQQEVTGGAIDD